MDTLETSNILTQTIPSYVYLQYQGDPDITAFFDAYNAFSQGYLDQSNALNLPNYLIQTGDLLDWVGIGIYGEYRYNLPIARPNAIGPYNTWALNTEVINTFKLIGSGGVIVVDDLAFQRILQWNNFKGDGFYFTIRWLKRRIQRFLSGTLFPDETYQISIVHTPVIDPPPYYAYTITITSGTTPLTLVPVLAAALQSNVLITPFQYTFTVVT